ncbi:lipoate--protein ligase [Enterococcus sp. LJL120]
MRYFIMPHQDIRYNLATEEYLMKTLPITEPTLLLYIQKPCVIIGRNQNAYAEIDFQYLKEQGITLTRRTSGGGAVYDDLGNLSFSFVTAKNRRDFGDYAGATAPIIQALQQMGAELAEVGGRNDLYIEGLKFSGNAMYSKGERTYSHGTLMYDVDLSVLDHVLKVDPEKIASKATKSVRKNVTNIKPYLNPEFQFADTADFRDELLRQIFSVRDLAEIAQQQIVLTTKDEAAIEKLFAERYANDQWVYGAAPDYQVSRRIRLAGVGIVELHFSIAAGKISAFEILGDFFGEKDIHELTSALIGQEFNEATLKEFLQKNSVSEYIFNFSNQDFLNLLFQ